MANSLDGAVALVTGASSGIGEATARELASLGAKVAVAARRLERLERLASEIGGAGHTALAIEADVTEQEQAVAAVDRTVDELGRLDIVVNNAGVMLLGPIEDAPTEEWERMIDLNLKGLLYTTRAAVPHLLSAAEDSERELRRPRQRQLRRRPARPLRLGRLQPDQARRRRLQRVLPPGVRRPPGALDDRRARRRRHRADRPSPRRRQGEGARGRSPQATPLEASDVADAIAYAVTRPWHVCLNEILIRPTEQVR